MGRKRIRKLSALACALLFLLSAGCSVTARQDTAPGERITLQEPQYVGPDDGGYPVFRFTWSRVKKLQYYDMAIYMEMDGYAERSRVSFTDAKETEAEIPFLKGIHTDTATYRIKIRPLHADNDAWSDVWRIDFVGGVYTVTGNAPDFDAPVAPATSESAPAQAAKEPVAHAFPEPLLTYEAKERGQDRDTIDLSTAAMLYVQVNQCEYGEPEQIVTDASVIAAATEAVAKIVVTGGSDNVSSTGTYTVFQFAGADGETLGTFAFQDGMLMEDDGRYPVSGLDALFAVDGIMLADDWDAYWEEEAGKEDAYAEAFQLKYPASVFALSGYNASMLDGIDPANIGYIRVSVSWNDYAGKLETGDPAEIKAIYEALSAMRVTGKVGEDDPVGQEWSVFFSFRAAGDAENAPERTAYLSFEGDYLLSGLLDGGTNMPYTVEGLDAFFDCTDADVLRYLGRSRNTRKPKPVYS